LTRTYEQFNNIEVVFTKKSESADHYIERIAEEVGRDYKITVATSDGMEQLIVLARGASRMSARELWHEIKAAKKSIRTDYIDNHTLNKNNLLESHLDQDVIDWMENLRRN
jgi:predicted RNA-binding protein with PIN domain